MDQCREQGLCPPRLQAASSEGCNSLQTPNEACSLLWQTFTSGMKHNHLYNPVETTKSPGASGSREAPVRISVTLAMLNCRPSRWVRLTHLDVPKFAVRSWLGPSPGAPLKFCKGRTQHHPVPLHGPQRSKDPFPTRVVLDAVRDPGMYPLTALGPSISSDWLPGAHLPLEKSRALELIYLGLCRGTQTGMTVPEIISPGITHYSQPC